MILKLCAIAVACVLIGDAEAAPRPTKFIPFAVISDLHRKSIKDDKNRFTSIVKYGELKHNGEKYTLSIRSENLHYFTQNSYHGLGAELSELIYFNGKLYTIDGEKGIIFEVKHGGNLIPWITLKNDDGNQKDGFQAKWATVKNDKLIVGSVGMAFLDAKTMNIDRDALWVKEISESGHITNIYWENQYKKVKNAMGITSGFVWHEAVNWSPRKNIWVFMPRKCSNQQFTARIEENTGCNQIITANENFSDVKAIKIDKAAQDPASGFSSFKFIPGTKNNDIFALKTIERNGQTVTYGTVIDITGKTLLRDKQILDDKYEGIAFFRIPKH
uniref:Apyrase n=1 Tax=Phlebotomus kandelakii TaxID=1109342 RepID=A0A7G7LID5_9DIPT|nr:apyrase [Phlebotomus kandelakii]